MTPPTDCPRCDSNATLKKIRADARGHVWLYCECCSATVLANAAGQIVHVSAA